MQIIKNKIRDLREDLDLRQLDVAEATGIDQKHYQIMKQVKQTLTAIL